MPGKSCAAGRTERTRYAFRARYPLAELEPKMTTLRTIAELRRALEPLRGDSTVGLVPTMGALHRGHGALFRAARAGCDVVVASVFVNPAQFSESADLAGYPRDLERDEREAAAAGVDFVFAPSVEEFYPPGFATWVDPAGAATGLESDHRAGHFRGVATACVKLFTIVRPDIAYFGRKDAQQVAVVKQIVRDLNLELEIQVVPTVRDEDGLALSSRNAQLSEADRARALAIPRALATRDPERARTILAEAGIEPEYIAVADLDGPTLAVAARVGSTRLIDNVLLEGEQR
jgi:pantoate--beta-alanine ligase